MEEQKTHNLTGVVDAGRVCIAAVTLQRGE